jgi:hypothetical protein
MHNFFSSHYRQLIVDVGPIRADYTTVLRDMIARMVRVVKPAW